jgi:hypothetical protein
MAGRYETADLLGWKSILGAAAAVVLASGLAVLLIPQLSLPAAIRGGSIALVSIVVSRVILTALQRRSRRRRAGE